MSNDLRQAALSADELLSIIVEADIPWSMSDAKSVRDNLRAALAAPPKQKRLTNEEILDELTTIEGTALRLPRGWRKFARAIETECAKRWGVEIEDEQD